MMEISKRLFAHIHAPALHVGDHFRRIANNAERGRGDQKRHDQQEPPSRINRVNRKTRKHLEPEWTELIHVVRHWLALYHDGTNHRGNRDNGQQADREPHRRYQLDQLGHETTTVGQQHALGRGGG